jgi:hypothetical protein
MMDSNSSSMKKPRVVESPRKVENRGGVPLVANLVAEIIGGMFV